MGFNRRWLYVTREEFDRAASYFEFEPPHSIIVGVGPSGVRVFSDDPALVKGLSENFLETNFYEGSLLFVTGQEKAREKLFSEFELLSGLKDFGKGLCLVSAEDNRVLELGYPNIGAFRTSAIALSSWIRRKEGMHLMHAGAIECRGDGVVLFAESGMGKSLYTFALSTTDDEIRRIGDDLVVVSELEDGSYEVQTADSNVMLREGMALEIQDNFGSEMLAVPEATIDYGPIGKALVFEDKFADFHKVSYSAKVKKCMLFAAEVKGSVIDAIESCNSHVPFILNEKNSDFVQAARSQGVYRNESVEEVTGFLEERRRFLQKFLETIEFKALNTHAESIPASAKKIKSFCKG